MKKDMVIAIDVGNTTVSVGIFDKGVLKTVTTIRTIKPASDEYYTKAFKGIIRHNVIEGAVISSVVPQTTRSLKRIFTRSLKIKHSVVGEDITVPIKNLYKDPRQVGQDRLVNAYAGYAKFGGGLIIVDFGTAVTFDIISRNGAYVGGIIVPGMETALHALSAHAALLPMVTVSKPASLIGKDTVESMLSGIVNGYGALCAGLVNKIRKEVGRGYSVIFTGGHAGIISRYCRHDSIQPNLTLEGLYLLYQRKSL